MAGLVANDASKGAGAGAASGAGAADAHLPAQGKRVLLGVTGCIAAYKACEILRGLQKAGCDVRVVMTESARQFVGETTFAALSGHAVGVAEFGDSQNPIPHIEFSQWADLFLIAPCTANVIAKIRAGIADDLLTSCVLACTGTVCVAPAMNVHMFENAATQENLSVLRARGIQVLQPAVGRLACGYAGAGKLPPVDEVVAFALGQLACPSPKNNGEGPLADAGACAAGAAGALAGVKVLITSGPTVEAIDPVRYISNHSSGKMGAALAQAACAAGAAEVVVVSGPVCVQYPAKARVVSVTSAQEMAAATRDELPDAGVVICAAAVCDMRPAQQCGRKLKKRFAGDEASLRHIEFVSNPDILAECARAARPDQVVAGFAAETDDLLENARAKLASKGADFIVANPVGAGQGFGKDENKATIVSAAAEVDLPEMSKAALAQQIVAFAAKLHSEGARN